MWWKPARFLEEDALKEATQNLGITRLSLRLSGNSGICGRRTATFGLRVAGHNLRVSKQAIGASNSATKQRFGVLTWW